MSFFTTFLETTPHFENAVAQKEQELKTIKPQSEEQLITLVQLAYCYAHVQLQKGIAAAEEAITLAETLNNQRMKANALCAKAMNEFRIGYIAHAQATAKQALSIFENINDEEGKCDAYFQLGVMPYISEGPGNTSLHLAKAFKAYSALGDKTGVYLVRIQQTLQIFLAAKFEEGTREVKSLIGELDDPHQRHLLCFAHMQLTISMHLRQDVIQFMNAIFDWQKIAEANGNFHDYTMTKAMLPDCYRLQHINIDVMQACVESIECAEKLGSIHGHCTVSIVMASILTAQGQYSDALFYFRKAIDAARKIEDGYKYLMALNATGEIYLKLEQIPEARETFETATREATVANDRLNLISAQRHLAELAYQQGEFDNALFDFKILFDSANNSDGWNMQDYGNYASSIAKASDEALQRAGLKPGERYTIRHHYLKKYLELAQQQQNEREESNACKALALYYEETNDLNAALKYHKEYIRLHEEIVNEQSIKNIGDLRMQYETQKKEQEMILLKQESEQALLNERLRISRELHDDIGSTLGSIQFTAKWQKAAIKKMKTRKKRFSKSAPLRGNL